MFRFTLYWSLVFYLPLFGLCGILAFLNIAFAPTPQHFSYHFRSPQEQHQPQEQEHELHPLSLTTFSSAASPTSATPFAPLNPNPKDAISTHRRTPPKVNPHRTRAVYALLALLIYLIAGLLGAVVGSAVIGYVLAALYKAGRFNMSTRVLCFFLGYMAID